MKSNMSEKVSVLYVEDEAATRGLVTNMLTLHGYNCIVAENGNEGLDLYRRHSPEIVLSDILMPVMSGLEMARAIRQEFPEAQFVFMTALGESKSILEAIDIGVTQYVVKPVDLPKLLLALSHCVAIIRLKAEAQRVKDFETIGFLTGGLAHDFNTLLQVVMGYVCLAKKGVDPDSASYSHLDRVESISKEAQELGKRLRTLSRGESGLKQHLPLMPSIAHGVKAALHGTDITPTFDLPADIPEVAFDKIQMQQVIHQLTLNAAEAMPKGGQLDVSARVSRLSGESSLLLPPGDYVHIVFRDTGVGIPAENVAKVFDPYFTTKQTSSYKGQGLGLNVCHSIISKHGGLINACNSSEAGATFNIWLPIAG